MAVPIVPDDFVTISKEMLDDSNAAKEQIEQVKSKLNAMLCSKTNDAAIDGVYLPDYLTSLIQLMRTRRDIMRRKFDSENVEHFQVEWCCNESPSLFRERWERLFREFCDVEFCQFDCSKVSELYDSLKYDGYDRQ